MTFQSKAFIIWGILGFCFWAIGYWRLFKRPEIYLPRAHPISLFISKRLIVFIIGAAGWVLISIALMGPRTLAFSKNEKILANDLFFVIDVSRSMLAIDFKPNRLEAAKKILAKYVELGPNDRIGIVLFSEKAFTLLPLTQDSQLLKEMVENIRQGPLGAGTSIGDALGIATARLQKSAAKNKVIVLLTDGVSIMGKLSPLDAADVAAENKIKIYSIGIGGEADAKIPVRGFGGRLRYQTIPGGSFDMETLKKIADKTGGKEFFAQNIESLDKIFGIIEGLEKKEIKVNKANYFKAEYWKYLAAGVFMLLLCEISRKIYLKEIW